MSESQERSPHAQLIDKLAHSFYQVVPEQYRTYCSLTSAIIEQVLTHFGVPCKRVPCQIWYTKPDHIYVIGFLGKSEPGKWDGHVVCCADGILIDAAVHHFAREFGLQVPWVITTPMFAFPTPALAQMNINSTDAIWWQPPPTGLISSSPVEPQELVGKYVDTLIQELSQSHGLN